jgi:excisionase family DNA binding protein
MQPNDVVDNGVLTLAEAARAIRCSKAHLLNIIHGRVANVPPFPFLRLGRRVLVRQEALDRWLREVEEPVGS